jgi:hypothetical protein
MITSTKYRFLDIENDKELFIDDLLDQMVILSEKYPDVSFVLEEINGIIDIKILKLNESVN